MHTATLVSYSNQSKVSKAGKPFKVYTAHFSDGSAHECGFGPLKGINPGDTISFNSTSNYGRMNIDLATVTKVMAGSAAPVAVSTGSPWSTPAPAAPTPPTPASGGYSGGGKVFPVPKLHGDRSIIRQNSLTNARELICTLIDAETPRDQKGIDHLAEIIISTAYKFEAYSSGDIELEKAKAMKAKAKKQEEAEDEADMAARIASGD